ncbi:MAG: hypothetical protein QOF30_2984, partial [Acidimicrobiaceae bacterium]|nr:hypothetical protein [Acidimicrobiaceae bacterium]
MGRSTAHRSRARRGEGPRLRAEILEAAERLLIDSGDEAAVSIRAVAQAVGVTPPSIYLHFADRSELIFAVCEEQFRHLDEAMEQAVVGVTDPWERIERRGRAYVEFGLTNPEHYRILFTTRPDLTPERFVDERLIATSAFGHLIEDLQSAAAAGQLGAGSGSALEDAALVASGLWMMVHGITSLLIAKPDFPWPDRTRLINHALETYGAGLRAGSPPVAPGSAGSPPVAPGSGSPPVVPGSPGSPPGSAESPSGSPGSLPGSTGSPGSPGPTGPPSGSPGPTGPPSDSPDS